MNKKMMLIALLSMISAQAFATDCETKIRSDIKLRIESKSWEMQPGEYAKAQNVRVSYLIESDNPYSMLATFDLADKNGETQHVAASYQVSRKTCEVSRGGLVRTVD